MCNRPSLHHDLVRFVFVFPLFQVVAVEPHFSPAMHIQQKLLTKNKEQL